MATALIALGSNLADPTRQVSAALEQLRAIPRSRLTRSSTLYTTAPVGGPPGQPAFVNAAALLETDLEPLELLDALQHIEDLHQRQRETRWGARTLDLDLLLVDQRQHTSPRLIVPHPRMSYRRFVMEPAAEIAPLWRHPTIGWTLAELAAHLRDTPPYVAIAGPIGAGKTELATRMAAASGAAIVREQLKPRLLADFYAAPASFAWEAELDFLSQRSELVSRQVLPLDQPVVSDFWFDQSLVFARYWLPAERHEEFARRFATARQRVATPRLIVLLDEPLATLRQRIATRARPYEESLADELLEYLRAELATAVRGQGPLLTLSGSTPEQATTEVLAALAAM